MVFESLVHGISNQRGLNMWGEFEGASKKGGASRDFHLEIKVIEPRA